MSYSLLIESATVPKWASALFRAVPMRFWTTVATVDWPQSLITRRYLFTAGVEYVLEE